MAIILENPVRGRIHAPSWNRPVGNTEFRVTQDFGPTPVTAEPAYAWPGGDGIRPGLYRHFHKGLDLGNTRCGADVLAAAPGTVILAGKVPDGAIDVIIRHSDGWQTLYGHLHDETVSVGQKVTAGALVGHVGSTGNSTACHLHFALRRYGVWRDPWSRLAQNTP